MYTTLEDLADKIETLNENTRELLYKMYLWNTIEDVDTIPVTLRVPNYPFFETFRIPTKKHAIDYVSEQAASLSGARKAKNWGSYNNNADLRSPITIIKGESADINILKYDGNSDSIGAVKINLASATECDSLEFIVTLQTPFPASDNHLVEFYNSNGVKICGLKNIPTSTVYDTTAPNQENVNITYKISFKYIPNENMEVDWKLFDYYAMPSYKYNSNTSSFRYSPNFVDPTA
jgi:hypothetical protein